MIWAILLTVAVSGGFISLAVVPLVARGPVQAALGPVRAGALGVAICAAVAVAGFWLWNPDHFAGAGTALARLKESAMLAAFAASFWLPWFLWSYGRGRRG